MTRLGLSGYIFHSVDEDVHWIFERVDDAGYDGIELSHQLYGRDFSKTRSALNRTGLEPIAVHVGLEELHNNLPQLVDQYDEIGCRTFVYDPDLYLRTASRVRTVIERTNEVADALEDHGFELLVHPIHRDLVPELRGPILGGVPWFTRYLESSDHLQDDDSWRAKQRLLETHMNRLVTGAMDRILAFQGYDRDNDLDWLLEKTAFGRWVSEIETVRYEIDIAFFVQMGYDPVEIIDFLGNRVPAIHMKDVLVNEYTPGSWPTWVDPHEGATDFPAVSTVAVNNDVDWLIFENGHADDPFESMYRGAEVLAPFCEAPRMV